MTTSTLAGAPESVTTPRRFLVLWQDADSRRFLHVGTLEHSSPTSPQDDGFYTFVYSSYGGGHGSLPGLPELPGSPTDVRLPRLVPHVRQPRYDVTTGRINATCTPSAFQTLRLSPSRC